eukprot:2065768-Pyramimonas_sp.AAC.1
MDPDRLTTGGIRFDYEQRGDAARSRQGSVERPVGLISENVPDRSSAIRDSKLPPLSTAG